MTPSPFPIIDGHVDLPYALQQTGKDIPYAELTTGPVTSATVAAGVRLLVCALYVADVHNGPGTALAELDALRRLADTRLAGLVPARTLSDLAPPSGAGSPRTLFLSENSDALLDADLDELEAWGLRIAGLTHVGRNRLADGNAVRDPQGLTPAGRHLLGRLAGRGWVLDLAHLSPPAFVQALAAFDGPVMVSHTGLRAFCDLPRNLDDGQTAALLERGGVIGIALAPELLSPGQDAGLAEVVRHLDHLVQRHGPGGVALGSDYGGFPGVCRGLEDYRRWRALAAALRGLGYPEASIGGIFGGNWARFYRNTRLLSPARQAR